LAYLLHIRIIDEHRDFEHDSLHHKNRALQTGLISKRELSSLNYLAVAVFLICALLTNRTAFIVALMALIYSELARKEFFAREKLRRRFFLYNSVNLVQMLLLQIFVYSSFAPQIPLTSLVLAHFLFTAIGTLVFEFIRKLKIPGQDGTGADTYTWHLGFKKSLQIYLFLALINVVLFYGVGLIILRCSYSLAILALSAIFLLIVTVLNHWKKKSKESDQIMQATFLLLYVLFNLIIYYVSR
jgi:4-hydroxybenzoate polyprenyltransferase